MKGKRNRLRIAVAGAGMSGAYLYAHLVRRGHHVDLYDFPKKTRCRVSPCAWGTSADFDDLVRDAGLNPRDYVLRRFDHLVMDEVKIRAILMTIDKPRLIQDLLGGADPIYAPIRIEQYDRVIDATGVRRAYLPPVDDDILLPCVQRLVRTAHSRENRIKLGGIGYAWCFPLSKTRYHIGCGSLVRDPEGILQELGWLSSKGSDSGNELLCGCAGTIRITGPHESLPFVTDRSGKEIWGIGEAIGCVAPLAGDGIVPGMKSVQVLLEHWEDSNAYQRAILKEFHWMKRERRVIDKLRQTKDLGLEDARVLRKNSKRMGIHIGLRHALTLLQKLSR